MTYPRYGILKNNQPRPIGLPFPFQGVLASGETIVTRYTLERLQQHMTELLKDGGAREMLVTVLNGAPTEAMVSPKSAPRDFFVGTAQTSTAASANVNWQIPKQLITSPTPSIPATALLPGGYNGILCVQGVAVGGSGLACFRATVSFQVTDAGAVANFATHALGTDDAGSGSYTLTGPSGGLVLAVGGPNGTLYQWTATLELQQVLSG
jgi:hypothetical protein